MKQFFIVATVIACVVWVLSPRATGHFDPIHDCAAWRQYADRMLAAAPNEREQFPEIAAKAYEHNAIDKHTLVLAMSIFNLYRTTGEDGLQIVVESACPSYALPNVM